MPMPWVVLAVALLQDPAGVPTPPELLPGAQPAPAAAPAAPAASGSVEAGLAAYHRRQFQKAADQFQAAADANPSDAAAAWYLAYTVYKIAEPKRPFHPDKQKAAELFAKAYALDPAFKPTWGR